MWVIPTNIALESQDDLQSSTRALELALRFPIHAPLGLATLLAHDMFAHYDRVMANADLGPNIHAANLAAFLAWMSHGEGTSLIDAAHTHSAISTSVTHVVRLDSASSTQLGPMTREAALNLWIIAFSESDFELAELDISIKAGMVSRLQCSKRTCLNIGCPRLAGLFVI